jgi:hypothetical protein
MAVVRSDRGQPGPRVAGWHCRVGHGGEPSRSGASQPVAPAPTPTPCGLAVTSPAVQCADTPECFGPMGKDHRAAVVACELPHAWEVFALGSLPDGLTSVDYDSVRKTQPVRGACTATTLALVDFNMYAWRVDVVAPTLDAYRHGDHTFRCVAGPASGMVTGSTFTRR